MTDISDRIPLIKKFKENTHRRSFSKSNIQKSLFFLVCSLIIIFFIIKLLIIQPKSIVLPRKKNFIFFVSDGTGPNYLTLARNYKQYITNGDYGTLLNLDSHLIGTSRTRSNSSLVTDSAAGATAFSCLLKTYNGAIGVDPFSNPCGTIMEAAKLAGYLTGLVVTTRITDATPASFSAHVDHRSQEDQIAEQQVNSGMVDLMIGGGLQHFVKTGRKDGLDLVEQLHSNWTVANDYIDFFKYYAQSNSTKHDLLPFMSLFEMGDVPFQVDKDHMDYKGPTLKQEAALALDLLHSSNKNDKGFFMLIEGSRIDHCGHNNDAACIPREVMVFDEAFEYVKEFADAHPDEDFILFSTSDHETGGMTISRQVSSDYPDYVWYPEVLNKVKHSGQYIIKELLQRNEIDKEYIEKIVFEGYLGIQDYVKEDYQNVKALYKDRNAGKLQDYLNDMVSSRARIGFTTHGHTAIDVNTYMYANSESLSEYAYKRVGGNNENTLFGHLVVDFLDLNMTAANEYASNVDHKPIANEVHLDNVNDMDYHKNI
jgi:alkaline phosphatase